MLSDPGIPESPAEPEESPGVPDGPSEGGPDRTARRSDPAFEEDALGPMLGRLGEDLRRTESVLAALLRERPSGYDLAGVETVDGREAQARRLRTLERDARRTIQAFQTGANQVAPVPTTLTPPSSEEPSSDGPRLDGNPVAEYRVLVDRDFLTEPAAATALEERVQLGHQLRVVDSPLIKLVIADGELAMVQVSQERSLLLRPPLVMLAVRLFEMAWQHSRPYLREGGDLNPVDRRILQLMLSGLTDAATAHQLGTSPRTVQRRLRALMDAASVTSRVQLGWYAMRNNWV